MKKNTITIILVGIIVLSIYGCGNKGKAIEEPLEAIEAMLEESEEAYKTPEQAEVQQTEDDKGTEPIYIIEPQLSQNDSYVMQDWQAAYVEYIESVKYAPYNKYALIYVDEDDIPELVICTGTVATACTVLTFHDGEVDALQTWGLQCNYIEKKNLYWDAGGQMGEFYDQVYTIENGKWVHVLGGEHIAKLDEDGLITDEYDYAWEGEAVPKDTYYENLHAVYDIEENQNVGSEQYVKLDEMLFCLQTGKYDPVTVMTKHMHYNADGSIKWWYEYEYDSAGNQTKYTTYQSDGSIKDWEEYEYDDAGNQVKVTEYNGDGSIKGWEEYKYDSVGNQVENIRYWSDGNIERQEGYEYDSAGNEVKHIRYGADGSIKKWYEYEYDGAGNEVKHIRYGADGSIEWWYEYEYDSAGNQVKRIGCDVDGSIKDWYEYEYDSAGNWVKWIRCDVDGSIKDWDEYEYDSAGNRVRWLCCDADGSIYYWYEYEYDSTGNRVKWIGCDVDGSIKDWCEYEYDSAGNETRNTGYLSDGSIDYWNVYEYITIIPL